jgi:monoamine oxidase
MVETAWWTEEWTRGCSFAHLRPGILSRYGPLLRRPWGRVHWAGTETATTSHGAIDGAVRSGERATLEILELE